MRYGKEFFTNPMIVFLTCVLVGSGVATVATYSGAATWVAFVSGCILFLIAEYLVHRFVLHEFPKLLPKAYQGHVAHHRYPTDVRYLFGPVHYDILNYTVLFAAVWALTRSLSVAAAVVFGASVSQMHYQWQHYVAHRPIRPWTPWGKRMKRWHLLHHYQDEHAWYGVSHPFMDLIMGTHRSKRTSRAAGYRDRRNIDGSN